MKNKLTKIAKQETIGYTKQMLIGTLFVLPMRIVFAYIKK